MNSKKNRQKNREFIVRKPIQIWHFIFKKDGEIIPATTSTHSTE